MTWYTTVLKKMGAPVRVTSTRVLALWALSEGTPPGINNWLACGTPWPGSTPYNSSGVQVYPTYNAGTSAIAWSLQHAPYTAIADAFRSGASPLALYRLINASPWCGGCQTGHYPVALWTGVGKPSPSTPTPPGTTVLAPTPPPPGATGHEAALNAQWARVQTDAGPHATTLAGRIIALATRIRKA